MAGAEQYCFTDIGGNLTDPVFRGLYRGKRLHPDDFDDVLRRAADVGVKKIIVTGSSLKESRQAVALCRQHQQQQQQQQPAAAAAAAAVRLYCTVGCHPTRSSEMEADAKAYLLQLRQLAADNRDVVVAVGETGLDFDREMFAPRHVQMPHFRSQVELACDLQLPLFVHCRASQRELLAVMEEFAPQLPSGRPGVVHTFDGEAEDAQRLLGLGFRLGLNGCSLKTERNLQVVSGLPLDRLLLETDAPWCELKPSHASHRYLQPDPRLEWRKPQRWAAGCLVKGRNEPACIVHVLQAVAGVLKLPPAEVAAAAYANTESLFFPNS